MDDSERPPIPENQPMDIYDARLTFRKKGQGEKVVNVTIRYSKKGRSKNEKLPFPQDIKDDDLCWTRYSGEQISVYHREDRYKYIDLKHSLVYTDLGQKLERLVREAHKRFQKIDEEADN